MEMEEGGTEDVKGEDNLIMIAGWPTLYSEDSKSRCQSILIADVAGRDLALPLPVIQQKLHLADQEAAVAWLGRRWQGVLARE